MKKKGIEEKPHKKKTLGLVRVYPGHGSTGFCRVIASIGLLTNLNRSNYRFNLLGGFNNSYGRTESMSERLQSITKIKIQVSRH
jgi:hypothetical protein